MRWTHLTAVSGGHRSGQSRGRLLLRRPHSRHAGQPTPFRSLDGAREAPWTALEGPVPRHGDSWSPPDRDVL